MSVRRLVVDDNHAGQRIDNFLLRELKGVPKSYVYRVLRSGEVRVDSRRVDPDHRLAVGESVRVPPTRVAKPSTGVAKPSTGAALPEQRADAARPAIAAELRLYPKRLFEDDHLLAIDKPAGVAVHGGSGVSYGVIEQLRRELPQQRFLELVHRLDRDTSGVLLLAKKRSALLRLHTALRKGECEKHYTVAVAGRWKDAQRVVDVPLHKYLTEAGERRVSVQRDGRPACTVFSLQQAWREVSLLDALLLTGRTHQIRVHLAHLGFPILGDEKYGDFELNKRLHKQQGLRRMFLHAASFTFPHPMTSERIALKAPLPADLKRFLQVQIS